MSNRFNLNILPISRQAEKMAPGLPGLLISSSPRRSPRRRSQEKLVLYLHLEGNAPLSGSAMEQLLIKLTEVYFQTDGSITSALRNVTDVLNKYLLDRNYRAASRGLKAIGYLSQIVLKEDRILYAQCGPSYIYQLSQDQVEKHHDPDLSGSGLGIAKSFKVRYHQINLTSNQLIILAPHSPSTWNENLLKNLPRMKPSAIVQRLIHKVDENLDAILFFPLVGDGEAKLIKPDWEQGVGALEISENDPAQSRPASVRPAPVPSPVAERPPIQIDEEDDPEFQLETPALDPKPPQKQIPEFQREKRPRNTTFADQVSAEILPALDGIRNSKTWTSLNSAGAGLGRFSNKIWGQLLSLISKMLPDDQILDLPSWTLGLVAVLVPLVMVIFGSVFYVQRGRNQLYEEHFSTAQTLIVLAATQTDPVEHYATMSEAMGEISSARKYQQTEEVEELFQKIRLEMDTLDRVTRLTYEPLFSRGLGADVTISKIVVTAWNDLYMLNADNGSVIWAQSNPEGYQIVDDFSCGPIEGHVTVGPLVDIVPLPTSQEDQATILGIDRNHTMIFCYADLTETPVIFEDTSYTLGRGPARAISMSGSSPHNLYILDPEKRAIWIEYQSQNYHEGSEYFGAIDSPEMADARELATNGGELFILHQDGYITKCVTERADADPICTTPFSFSDPRPGQEPSPFFLGAEFTSFAIKSSPGTALYLLDAGSQSLYRFSTQLEYQEQFRPRDGIIDQPVTAFAITMSDRAFLAVDDQVYTAQLLP